jgi:hypothetical protein
MVMLELQPSQLPLQWPVPLLSWCGVPVHVHVGSHWAVAGLPWTLSLHHLPPMSLLPLQPLLPIAALQLLALVFVLGSGSSELIREMDMGSQAPLHFSPPKWAWTWAAKPLR